MIFVCHVVLRVSFLANNRSSNLSINTTLTSTSLNTEVTLFTPSRTPTVLDIPEIDVVVGTITSHEDSMVKSLLRAELGSMDTFLVELEVSSI